LLNYGTEAIIHAEIGCLFIECYTSLLIQMLGNLDLV
jgi:hypothetical protein